MTDEPGNRIPFTSKIRIPRFFLASVLLLGVLTYFLMFMYKEGSGVGFTSYAVMVGNLKLLLTYYLPFETISLSITILLLRAYHNLLKINFISFTTRGIVYYELIMLPILTGSIFVFAPITNFIRYSILYYPTKGWQTYYPEHFFTARMYLNYLVPTLMVGYILVNYSLFINYRNWKNGQLLALTDQLNALANNEDVMPAEVVSIPIEINSVDAYDQNGQTELAFRRVLFFEVENKQYLAHTPGKTYTIRQTLMELEAVLPVEQFYRVNRSSIINLVHFKNYAYWENDKYIIRLTDDKTTFVMQRARLDEFRKRLKMYQAIDRQPDSQSEAAL